MRKDSNLYDDPINALLRPCALSEADTSSDGRMFNSGAYIESCFDPGAEESDVGVNTRSLGSGAPHAPRDNSDSDVFFISVIRELVRLHKTAATTFPHQWGQIKHNLLGIKP
jgi:hypothetical protein